MRDRCTFPALVITALIVLWGLSDAFAGAVKKIDGVVVSNEHGNRNGVIMIQAGQKRLSLFYDVAAFGIETGARVAASYKAQKGDFDGVLVSIQIKGGKVGDSPPRRDVASSRPIQIGVLRSVEPPGCGCYFSPVVSGDKAGSEKYLFISDATGKAYINLDGRDMVLMEVGRKQRNDEYGYCQEKTCTYSANDVKATVKFLRKSRTEYEVRDYDVMITIARGGVKETVNGKGSCGC
jgi:hypothetical protein